MKTHFTRKNFIALALIYFYLLIVVLCTLLCDGTNPIGIKASMNFVKQLGGSLGFPTINGSAGAWILVICFLIYVLIFSAAFIYEMRLAKYYDNKIFTKKWVITYVITFVVCFGLALAIGLVAQYPYNPEYIGNSFLFLLQGLLTGLILYAILATIVAAIVMLYVNFKNIDKPFRFFGERVKAEEEMQEERDREEAELYDEQGRLAESFGDNSNPNNNNNNGNNNNPNTTVANGISTSVLEIGEKERVFPGLCTIDVTESVVKEEEIFDQVDSLEELCNNFRLYLAKQEGLYFDIETIRAFISGLAASRLIILEGLSGTGKSSLARYFSDFIGEESYFEAVQATWRDRSSVLGYYNDFSKSYNETEFLKRMYRYTYRKNHINIMVLDEVNISRVEYYFADFLSILEYPVDKWKLKIMQLPYQFDAPTHLEDGILQIPSNTWFIATANKDDSTFTITDKVYDRAITISFDDRNEEFKVNQEVKPIKLSYNGLRVLFRNALAIKENALNVEDRRKFKLITDFIFDTFDLTFGNRINTQIDLLVPIYVSCGGSKESALDFMLSRKVISKLQGRFEDYIKQGLIDLRNLISKTYGKDAFPLTNREINKLIKKL